VIDCDLDFDEYSQIDIGNDVWVGARAVILDGVFIDDGATVATNAISLKIFRLM